MTDRWKYQWLGEMFLSILPLTDFSWIFIVVKNIHQYSSEVINPCFNWKLTKYERKLQKFWPDMASLSTLTHFTNHYIWCPLIYGDFITFKIRYDFSVKNLSRGTTIRTESTVKVLVQCIISYDVLICSCSMKDNILYMEHFQIEKLFPKQSTEPRIISDCLYWCYNYFTEVLKMRPNGLRNKTLSNKKNLFLYVCILKQL